MWTVLGLGVTAQVASLCLSVGGHLALSLHSSNELGNSIINTIMVISIRPHRSTTYIDAAYCYRLSTVVCRSVCHTSKPCKNG